MPAVLRVKMDETDMMIALMFVAYLCGCLVAVWIVETWEQTDGR